MNSHWKFVMMIRYQSNIEKHKITKTERKWKKHLWKIISFTKIILLMFFSLKDIYLVCKIPSKNFAKRFDVYDKYYYFSSFANCDSFSKLIQNLNVICSIPYLPTKLWSEQYTFYKFAKLFKFSSIFNCSINKKVEWKSLMYVDVLNF